MFVHWIAGIPLSLAHAGWPSLEDPAAPSQAGRSDAAIVVGIEDYTFLDDIPGARANAEAWYRHLTQGLGVPVAHVQLLRDAQGTDAQVMEAVERALSQTSADGRLWFVWIGHGAPAPDGKGLLVGVDAQASAIGISSRSVGRDDVLAQLARGQQAETVVVFDAAFNGRTPDGGVLVPDLQPVLPVYDTGASSPRTLVLTAARKNQPAAALSGAARPAFSYLLLGAMRGWGDANGDGVVRVDEALAYVDRTLRETNARGVQQPERIGGDGSWALGLGRERAPDPAVVAPAPPPAVAAPSPTPPTTSAATTGYMAQIARLQAMQDQRLDQAGSSTPSAPAATPAPAPALSGTRWTRICEACDYPLMNIRLGDDGTFGHQRPGKPGSNSWSFDSRDTWTYDGTTLTLVFDEGWSVETYDLRAGTGEKMSKAWRRSYRAPLTIEPR